jgi:hypothetical protein
MPVGGTWSRRLCRCGRLTPGIAVFTTTAFIALVCAIEASAAPVPAGVRKAIKKRVAPAFAYVPQRIPSGWQLDSWDPGTQTPHTGIRLNLWFGKPPGADAIGFQVSPAPRSRPWCGLRPRVHSYRIGGVRVFWSADQVDGFKVWRCFSWHQRRIAIIVTGTGRTFFGPDFQLRAVRKNSLGLAWMIASAHRLR